jgi:N-hydroxyarylamine O-acetyltransferase
VDYEVANHYASTHPDSIFTQTLTVQHRTPVARHILRGSDLTIDRGETVETRTVSEDELPRMLAETFGLRLPADVRLPTRLATA